MSNEQSGSVTCVVCGQSCEGKPHAKDTKGRIICRPCIDKKKAQRAATDTGGAAVMAGLLSKSKMANATPCPGCKSYMPEGTTVCTHCGYNTETGKAATTRVFDAPKQKKAKSSGREMSFDFDPMMGVWIMAAIYGALAVGCFLMPSALIVFLLIAIVHSAIAGIWLFVVLILDGHFMWLLLSLIPIVGAFLLVYLVLTGLERPAVKGHWIVATLATILAGALFSSFGPEDDQTALLTVEPQIVVVSETGPMNHNTNASVTSATCGL